MSTNNKLVSGRKQAFSTVLVLTARACVLSILGVAFVVSGVGNFVRSAVRKLK